MRLMSQVRFAGVGGFAEEFGEALPQLAHAQAL
jgi:hypothetical protein